MAKLEVGQVALMHSSLVAPCLLGGASAPATACNATLADQAGWSRWCGSAYHVQAKVGARHAANVTALVLEHVRQCLRGDDVQA